MTDTGGAVAVDGIFDDVKADERDKAGDHQRDQGANPSGSIEAAVFVELDEDLSGGGGIAEKHGEEECEKETVAARALEEIGSGDGAEGVQAAAPASAAALRCVVRTAR